MKRTALLIGAVGLLGAQAYATDWFDDFESYPLGSEPCGSGGWEGWGGSSGVCGQITDTVGGVSGTQALFIEGVTGSAGDDTVQPFYDITSGQWEFVIWTYMPSASMGDPYVILLNTYHTAAYNWSAQIRFDRTYDIVVAEFDEEEIPMIFDQWVELKLIIDLDNDLVDYYYGGVQFVTGKSWVDGVSGGGQVAIEALDLYAQEPPGGSEGIYFDDVSLTCLGPDCPVDCPPDYNGDGVVNSQDFVAFLNDFVAGNPGADYNGDGTINSQDFVAFLNDFVAGC